MNQSYTLINTPTSAFRYLQKMNSKKTSGRVVVIAKDCFVTSGNTYEFMQKLMNNGSCLGPPYLFNGAKDIPDIMEIHSNIRWYCHPVIVDLDNQNDWDDFVFILFKKYIQTKEFLKTLLLRVFFCKNFILVYTIPICKITTKKSVHQDHALHV
jgi:hypothetical protein